MMNPYGNIAQALQGPQNIAPQGGPIDRNAMQQRVMQQVMGGGFGENGGAGGMGVMSDLFRGALSGYMGRRAGGQSRQGWGINQLLERFGHPLGGQTAGSLGGPGSVY